MFHLPRVSRVSSCGCLGRTFFPAVAPSFLLYWAWQLRAICPARKKNAKNRAKQANKIRLMKCEGKRTWGMWWEVTEEGINLCRTCEEIEKAFLSLLWCGDFSPCVAHASKPMIVLLWHGRGVLSSWGEIHTFSWLRKLWGYGFPQVRVSLQRKEWPKSPMHMLGHERLRWKIRHTSSIEDTARMDSCSLHGKVPAIHWGWGRYCHGEVLVS